MFGLWAFVRVLMMFTLGEGKKAVEADMADLTPAEHTIVWLVIAVMIVSIGLVFFAFHYYVGMSSIKEGHGTGKGRWGFIVVAAIFAIANVSSVIHYFLPGGLASIVSDANSGYATAAATFLIDITGTVMYTEIVFCSTRLRMFKRIMDRQQAKGAA